MDAAATAFRKGHTARAHDLLRHANVLRAVAEQKDSEASRAMFRAK